MRDLLERLVKEMVDRGIHYRDARREFEYRFLTEVLSRHDHSLCDAARELRIHRNTLSRKLAAVQKARRGRPS